MGNENPVALTPLVGDGRETLRLFSQRSFLYPGAAP